MKTITVGAKRRDNEWRAAIVVDNELHDVMIEESLPNVLAESLGVVLGQTYAEGSEITVTVVVKSTGTPAGD